MAKNRKSIRFDSSSGHSIRFEKITDETVPILVDVAGIGSRLLLTKSEAKALRDFLNEHIKE